MKVYVASFVDTTKAPLVTLPRLGHREQTVIAEKPARSAEVTLIAIITCEADADAWKAAVGKTLTVYEQDMVPDG